MMRASLILLALLVSGCSAFVAPKVKCHDETVPLTTKDTATGPLTITATLTRRICERT